MCGAYELNTLPRQIRELFPRYYKWQLQDGDLVPSGKIGPSAKKPGDIANHRLVVRSDGKETAFSSLRWRYETKWMRDKGIRPPINARSETMFTNGLFKRSAIERRCLVVVDGFYEPKGPKGTKREQFAFEFKDSRPFALGGLWTQFKSAEDEFEGFVICTTEANDQVAPIHPRMPVVLDGEEAWRMWLEGNEDDARFLCEPGDTPELYAKKA